MISIVVPTYREADNLSLLAHAVDAALLDFEDGYELLFVDDDSQDGSEEIAAELSRRFPARILVRKGERGLASAVIEGIRASSGDIIVVMDGDLSHPPEVIPIMVQRLRSSESDFVLGSRYVEGGSVDEAWSGFRKLNSAVASLLVRPLCQLKDPMSGFFALRRADMPDLGRLSPIGYKIALELVVKGDFRKTTEVPIHFAERRYGESKLSLKEQLSFIRHLRRLYAYRLRPHR